MVQTPAVAFAMVSGVWLCRRCHTGPVPPLSSPIPPQLLPLLPKPGAVNLSLHCTSHGTTPGMALYWTWHHTGHGTTLDMGGPDWTWDHTGHVTVLDMAALWPWHHTGHGTAPVKAGVWQGHSARCGPRPPAVRRDGSARLVPGVSTLCTAVAPPQCHRMTLWVITVCLSPVSPLGHWPGKKEDTDGLGDKMWPL